MAGAALSQGAVSTLCELGDSKMQKTLASFVNSALRRLLGRGFGAVSERSRQRDGEIDMLKKERLKDRKTGRTERKTERKRVSEREKHDKCRKPQKDTGVFDCSVQGALQE